VKRHRVLCTLNLFDIRSFPEGDDRSLVQIQARPLAGACVDTSHNRAAGDLPLHGPDGNARKHRSLPPTLVQQYFSFPGQLASCGSSRHKRTNYGGLGRIRQRKPTIPHNVDCAAGHAERSLFRSRDRLLMLEFTNTGTRGQVHELLDYAVVAWAGPVLSGSTPFRRRERLLHRAVRVNVRARLRAFTTKIRQISLDGVPTSA